MAVLVLVYNQTLLGIVHENVGLFTQEQNFTTSLTKFMLTNNSHNFTDVHIQCWPTESHWSYSSHNYITSLISSVV